MRSIARIGLAAAVAVLAGCQILTYEGDRFSSTVYDEIPVRHVRFPTKITYPDYTMFGFPMYGEDPRADLRLDAIGCHRTADGTLVVVASVHNMGAEDIYRVPFTGDMAAFRIAATVTTAASADRRWTQFDEQLVAPVWSGDDDRGSLVAPLYRGAAVAMEIEPRGRSVRRCPALVGCNLMGLTR